MNVPAPTNVPVIDASGLLCPLPVLRLRKALLAVPPGGQLRLIATDPAAVVDVPHFCAQSGHVLVGMRELPGGACEYTVQRGPDAPLETTPVR